MTLREVLMLAPKLINAGARSDGFTATQPQLKQRFASTWTALPVQTACFFDVQALYSSPPPGVPEL